MLVVVKVENKNTNQVSVKRYLFKLDFSKYNGSTNVANDSSFEVIHDAINVDEIRINPRE